MPIGNSPLEPLLVAGANQRIKVPPYKVPVTTLRVPVATAEVPNNRILLFRLMEEIMVREFLTITLPVFKVLSEEPTMRL